MILMTALYQSGRIPALLRLVQARRVMSASSYISYVFRSIGVGRFHGRANVGFVPNRDVSNRRAWSVRRTVGSWLRHFPAASVHSAPQGLGFLKAALYVAVIGAAFAWAPNVSATGLTILDFTEVEGETPVEQGFCDASQAPCGWSHRREGFTWRPKASTEVCEVLVPLRRYAGTAGVGANVDMQIIASPSGTVLATSDASVPATSIGTVFLEQTFQFINSAQPGQSCYLLQSGQTYTFWLRQNVGVGSVNWALATEKQVENISATTKDSWSTDLSGFVSDTTREVAWRALGFGPFTGSCCGPGTDPYENAQEGDADWITHEDYFTGVASQSEMGFFGNMLRDLAIWLFVPNEATQDAFEERKDDLLEKVPFSYFGEIASIADAGVAASGSVPIITLSNPALSASVSMFSSARIAELAPAGFLDLMRTLAEVALWLTFVWFVWTTLHRLFT